MAQSRRKRGSRRGGTAVIPTTTIETQEDGPVEPELTLPEVTIEELPDSLRKAAETMGWASLMPVQAKAIPYVLDGHDLMVQSRTGTGKTGAFVLPILERIDPEMKAIQSLVLVPTRELARQVCAEAESLSQGSGIRTVAVYGGVGYGPQLEALQAGAQFVVGTPGRILDHLMRKSMILSNLKILVFDEADRMLSVGFYPDIKAIEPYLPKVRDGFMFSATYPPRVRSLARQFLDEPEMLSLSTGNVHAANTEHLCYEVPSTMEKDRTLVRLIEMKNPDSAIIFCNTKANVHYVTVVLQRFGYDADELSSDLQQNQREKVLQRVYDKKLRFLVATDVAARGIDIESLSQVILYDFPEDSESYIHRSGRTGRAGASGEAIAIVDPIELLQMKAVAKQYGIDVQYKETPTEEDLEKRVSERVTALLEAKLRNLDKLVKERIDRMMPLAASLGDSEDERAVVAMLLDDYYQQTLHRTPEMEEAAGGMTPSEIKAAARRENEASRPPRGRGGDRGGRGGGGGRGGRRDGGRSRNR